MAAIIVLDFDKPWDIMSTLQAWLKTLQSALLQLVPELGAGAYEKMKQRIENHIKTYDEPQLDEHGHLLKTKTGDMERHLNADPDHSAEEDEEPEDIRLQMPLPEGVLKVNLGIPILIVVQKSDLVFHGEKSRFLEENFDFIQKHLRDYALQYGATISFVSAKGNKNLDTVYKYLLHRVYDFDFGHKANLVDKDQLFIPSGFDSRTLIDEVNRSNTFLGPDGEPLQFEEVVRPPQLQAQGAAARNLAKQQKQEFLECPDWNQALQSKFLGSPKPASRQDKSQKEASDRPKAAPVVQSPDTRQSLRESIKIQKEKVGVASEGGSKPTIEVPAGGAQAQPRTSTAAGNKSFFLKLLNNEKLKQTKQQQRQAAMDDTNETDKDEQEAVEATEGGVHEQAQVEAPVEQQQEPSQEEQKDTSEPAPSTTEAK